MEPIDKKAAIAAYKEQKTLAGIGTVRCTATGQVWLVDSRNVDSFENRIRFELRSGGHRDRTLQTAWAAHGEAAFAFEILERLPEDTSPLLLRGELKARLEAWRARLA